MKPNNNKTKTCNKQLTCPLSECNLCVRELVSAPVTQRQSPWWPIISPIRSDIGEVFTLKIETERPLCWRDSRYCLHWKSKSQRPVEPVTKPLSAWRPFGFRETCALKISDFSKAYNKTAPSHYLNQWWNIVNWTLRNKLQWNFNRNLIIFIQENPFQNVVWKMAAILSRPQCVNL